jgi:polysaccharide biosynthesis/export protein
LQTSAVLLQVQRQRADLTRQLDRLAYQRRIALINDLRDCEARLADWRARLDAIEEKMPLSAGAGATPEITIVRKNGQQWEKLRVDEDAELRPGDVVEVVLRAARTGAVATN